jgi:hypothetical protein
MLHGVLHAIGCLHYRVTRSRRRIDSGGNAATEPGQSAA